MAQAMLRTSRGLTGLVRQAAAGSTSVLSSANNRQPSRGYAEMAFTFASPASVYYNAANVKQVDVPSFSGSFGILPNHVPLLAVLRPGVLTVHEADGNNKKYFVSSGSITINEDSSVQILAEEACTVDQLDAQAVRDGATKAAQDLQSASSEVAKAEAGIAVECYEALQRAVDHA
uniref:F-ATPase delta subunit n=1 Tax=Enchytraeus albidus TaxID=6390 RepID=A0A286Q4V7_9ANNE|nr:mitochondrial ATP synthase subunit delta precursor [Enchytraeus albidus]